jgi:hypothetical protein
MKTKLGTSIVAVFLAAAMVFSIGCSDDDEGILNPGTPPEMGSGAMLRVVHASPDAPAVDVYAEGVSSPLISNLAYGGASAYLDLEAGDYNIQLRRAGAPATSTPAFETGELTIPDGAKITAVAAGLLGSSGAEDKFRVLTYAENFSDPGTGNAAVRIIHASADAPTVALDVGDDATADIENFERFAETGVGGVALPAGTALQVAVWVGSTRVTAFTTPALPEGAELFVIATGLLSELPRDLKGFSLLAIGPEGPIGFIKQNPVVFALHASPDAPAVDIYAGAAKLVSNLAFGGLSGAVQVPPASYELDFKAAGSSATAATLSTPALAAGERYLAVASGFLSDEPSFRLLPFGESFAEPGAGARVRVVHASPDAPAVDVGTVDNNVLTPVPDFTNLAFEASSSAAGTALPAGTLPIGIAVTGQTTPVVTFDVTTSTGLKAFAVAAGALDDTKGEAFRLVIVDATRFPWASAVVPAN